MKNNIHKKWMDALYLNPQYYKGIKLQLIPCHPDYYGIRKAKRFVLGDSKYGQNIWIPNKFLTPSGVIIEGVDIDFVIREACLQHKLRYAHIPEEGWK